MLNMVPLNLANSKFSKMASQEGSAMFNLSLRRVQKMPLRSSIIATKMERRLRFNITSRRRIEKSRVRNILTYSFKIFQVNSPMMSSRKFSPHSDQLTLPLST